LRNGNNSLGNARARCDISNISSTPNITITGTLNYLGLWRKYDLTNSNEMRVRVKGTSCAAPNQNSNTVNNCAAASVPGLNANITYTVNANSSVTVTFTGTLIPAITRIELRDVVVDTANDWLTQNNWQQLMYYAVSPGYAPGGGNACAPLPGAPSCLTVNGNGGGNNNRAIVALTGSALAGLNHPSGTLSDYLEGTNATPASFIYENKTRSATFNDQVTIVAP
jgi:hypothetical protein